MISRVPILQSIRRDFVDFNWVGPNHHEVDREIYIYPGKNGGCHLTASAKGTAVLQKGRDLGAIQTPSASDSDWHIICAPLLFDEELKVQVPAQGSLLGQPAMAQAIPSAPGRSWVAKRSFDPRAELLSGHSLLQVGQWLTKSQSGSLAQMRWRRANPFLAGILI